MGFAGFAQEGIDFLSGLEQDNSKAYFDEHRSAYRGGLFEPAKALIPELGDYLQSHVSPGIVADPKGSMFRINRDIRFSADKTPYKTHVGLYFWDGPDKKTSPGLYLGIDPHGVTVGAGAMSIPDVTSWREAIAADDTGEAWVAAFKAAGGNRLDWGGAGLKTVPRPYPQDHPRAEWLKLKGLHMGRTYTLPRELRSAKFVEWAGSRFEPFAPALEWLVANLR